MTDFELKTSYNSTAAIYIVTVVLQSTRMRHAARPSDYFAYPSLQNQLNFMTPDRSHEAPKLGPVGNPLSHTKQPSVS